MQSFTAVIERDEATGLFVGYVPGWPGAHSQGATLDELRENLEEVVAMLLEDGAPKLEGEFVGTQTASDAVHAGAATTRSSQNNHTAKAEIVRNAVHRRGKIG